MNLIQSGGGEFGDKFYHIFTPRAWSDRGQKF